MRKNLIRKLLIILLIIFLTFIFNQKSDINSVERHHLSENIILRKLLSENQINENESESVVSTNCTIPAIENFPHMPKDLRKSLLFSLFGGFIIVYLFIGTALICDHYFVPSLEVICDKLNLESDVAGSTFMAAGSSAPELAAAVIGVFVAKDDIGVGTVVGSAVFNIAFVISICALFAGRVIQIHWWPIFRDSFFYLISICLLFVAMFDTKISLIDSITFLVIYSFYILFMAFNKQIERILSPKISTIFRLRREDSSDSVGYDIISDSTLSNQTNSNSSSDVECIGINYQNNGNIRSADLISRSHRSTSLCKHLDWIKKCWNYFIYPLNLIHRLTVTDCKSQNKKSWFGFTFVMSCIWISIYSYIIVWMITIIGFNLHIPDTVMGLIFIAFGASIPDAITSLIVVRQGLGDMALTNAISSNVFDILVCLGLPWFLQTAVIEPGSQVNVISRGLEYTTLSLLSTVVFFLVATHLNGWKLTKKYGIILMIWYFAFISMSSLYELNIFGELNPPMCWN